MALALSIRKSTIFELLLHMTVPKKMGVLSAAVLLHDFAEMISSFIILEASVELLYIAHIQQFH